MAARADHPRIRRRSTLAALRRLGPYVWPERWPLIGSALAALASMLCGLTIPLVTQRIVDGPIAHHDAGHLPWLVAVVLALGAAEAGLFFVRRRLVARPTTTIEARMRADLYHHLQRLPVAFHDQWQSGQLLSRAVGDLSTVRRFVAFVLTFLIVNGLTLLVGIGVLFALSTLAGVIMVAGAVPLVIVSVLYESRFKVAARRAQDQQGELATTVEEAVLGIRVLKAFGRGPDLAARFAGQARELRGTELYKISILALLWAVIIALPELALAGQIAAGTAAIAHGAMTVGTLVAVVTVSTYLRWPTDSIGWLLAEANQAASACERYWEVRDAPRTVGGPPRPRPLPAAPRGALRLEGVRFGYPGASAEVLRGVDLEIRPGETVALVGATGSGKTTLAALVPRLADVTGGRITVDGIDVRDLALADLRRVVATAFEDPVLFSMSVRENVALGRPEATEAEIRAALRVAHAEEFVDALPWGLATRIGEQGLSLSGGQRQRLALARAVVGRPAVLVLDDPLSALDVHTEAEVEAALRRVLRDTTALIVAHRPSTVRLADRVALLAGGRIAAVGSHAELLTHHPGYRSLLTTGAAAEAGGRPNEEVAAW
ncbi:ABC transporter ATP-binding protein [Gandjariella thermophila]|uniref:ABC transporter ATP-binding protein n=1 Tax=Gandjariella thermophila TaxID=1931992 RepID=A0A4D4J8G0_9PSEU|nr:ABC transporter ATP-binding protein [Gandjariella thermophila]GDY30163.1 ABC transporter ATP-binding protein [Gandjariella thermophila]